jgi:hypothetical protein
VIAMVGQAKGSEPCLTSGTPSPNPWDLSLSRQNVCFTLEALERRIELRRDATRAPIQGPEWQGAALAAAPKDNPKTPSNISLLRAKNGLDNGVHFRSHIQAGAEIHHVFLSNSTSPSLWVVKLLLLRGKRLVNRSSGDDSFSGIFEGCRLTKRNIGAN